MSNLTKSIVWILIKRNYKFWTCLSIVLFIIMLALLGPYSTPYKPNDVVTPRLPPQSSHPFGTDNLGYDVFSASVYGLRVSLMVGFVAAVVATTVGVTLGLIAGLKGGIVDSIIDSITNILIAIPTVFIMIIVGTFYVTGAGAGTARELLNMIFIGTTIGLLMWHWTARAVRSQVIALKTSDYVAVSILSGNSSFKVLIKDILPNIASYILLVFVIQLANGLATSVTLEFLGIKASEWSLFARVMQWLQMGALIAHVWWAWLIPGALIVMLIASLYIIVLALDEVFNPRLRRI